MSQRMDSSAVKKDSKASWFYLVFVFLVTFFVFGFIDSYGVLLVYLVKHFDEKNSKAAWVGSAAMSGCLFLYPFTLRVRHKFGIRASVLFAGVLLLPLFLASPMVPSMNFLFLTFSVPLAIAASLVGCATLTTILDYFEKFQGVAFGVRLSASSLGAIMFSYLIPILLEEIGWQRTFWILTGICFVTMCFALAYNDTKFSCDHADNNNNNEEMVQKIDDTRIYYGLLKNKEYLAYLIANTVFASVVFMPPVFMVQFATNLGHDLSISKWLMIIRGIVAVVIRLSIGRLVDKVFKRRKVRLVVFTVMVLFSVSTMLCTLATSFSMLIAYMAFISVVDSVYWLILPLLSKEITRNVHTDKAIVLLNCIGSFSTLAGPPVLGWIYDRTGDFRPVLYTVSAVSAIAACLIALRYCLVKSSHLPSESIEELILAESYRSSISPYRSIVYMENYVDPEVLVQHITVV